MIDKTKYPYQDVSYNTIEKVKGYAVLFGNVERGWHFSETNLTLQQWWRKAVKMTKSPRVGDIVLFYNGKAIRSVWNFETRILHNKFIEDRNKNGNTGGYKVIYNKYKYE